MRIAEERVSGKEAWESEENSITMMINLITVLQRRGKKELIDEDEFSNATLGERARIF